jgi:DNA-binding NarL/FixJ family response regulator
MRRQWRGMATTVLVVDDHSGFRSCVRRLLERQGYRVVGEAKDGISAVMNAGELRPELALVDVHLPDIDGFEVTSRLVALDPAPAVVLTSSHDRSDLDGRLVTSGARGFVRKDELSREAIDALL